MSGQRAIIAGVERTMELRPPNTVRCDVEGCGAETYVHRSLVSGGARAEAATRGWGFVDGRDLCPAHFAQSDSTT